MELRRIQAVFKKQIKDTLKNKTVLIQFILFPLMALILSNTISSQGIPSTYFVTLFAPMYIGMAPLTSTASIISEEKERNTLRVLMMANVKPVEYLLGIGLYIFIICSIGCLAFGLIAGYSGIKLLLFVLILMAGLLTSILVGATIGIKAKNQMEATSLTVPTMLIFAFLPMISMYNDKVKLFSKYIYTQQLNYLVNDPMNIKHGLQSAEIIILNTVLFIVAFIFLYRKRGLVE